MSALYALYALLDTDQGGCPEGHDCHLIGELRSCDVGHAEIGGPFVGLPLIGDDVTAADIDTAERLGVDPDMIEWARDTLQVRAEWARNDTEKGLGLP